MEGSGHRIPISEEQLELMMDYFVDDEVELLKIPVQCKSICHAIALSSDNYEIGTLCRKLYVKSICIKPSLSVAIDSCKIIARAIPDAQVSTENVGDVKNWAKEMMKVYESQSELLIHQFETKRQRENVRFLLAVSMTSVILSVI